MIAHWPIMSSASSVPVFGWWILTPPEYLEYKIEYTRKSSSQTLPFNGVVYQNSNTFYDFTLTPKSGSITNVEITMDGFAPTVAPWHSNLWTARVWAPAEGAAKVLVVSTLDDGSTESFTFFLTVPVAQPEGAYSNIVEGTSYDNGKEVVWTYGKADPGRTLLGIDTGVYRLPEISPITSSSVSDDNQAGVHFQTAGPLNYGDYVLRATYRYDDGDVIKDTPFSVPAPDVAPFQSSLFVYPTTIFDDGSTNLTIYVDHSHTLVRRWITIDGVAQPDLPLEGGTRSHVLDGFTIGTHDIQVHAEFSDTVPTSSSSDVVQITVNDVPVATLMDGALADYTDNVKWQAIIDDPAATPRQKLFASEIADLNDYIASGGPFASAATNDRTVYLAEEGGKANPKTFGEWFDAQKDYSNSVEIEQGRQFMIASPTSDVDVLILYLDYTPLAFQSIEFILAVTAVNEIRELRSAGVPDSVILNTWMQYKDYVAKKSGAPVPFLHYLRGAR